MAPRAQHVNEVYETGSVLKGVGDWPEQWWCQRYCGPTFWIFLSHTRLGRGW
jgi:hypothetical protein